MPINLSGEKFLFIAYITGEWQTYHRRVMFEKMAKFTGEKIKTLVSKKQQIGTYNISWESLNMSNGVYYLQLQTVNQTITNKMIILK